MQCLQQLQSLAQQGEPQAAQALSKLSSEMATMPLPPQVMLKCLKMSYGLEVVDVTHDIRKGMYYMCS